MSTPANPFQIVVIPKGLKGNELALTLSIVPSAEHPEVARINLPELLKQAGPLSIFVQGIPNPIWVDKLPQAVTARLSPGLWADVFNGAAYHPPKFSSGGLRALAFDTTAAATAVYLHAASLGVALTGNNDSRKSAPAHQLRVPVKLKELPKVAGKAASAHSFIANAIEAVDYHFLRPGQSPTQVMEDLFHGRTLKAADTQDKLLDELLKGYEPALDRVTGADNSEDPLRTLGIKRNSRNFVKGRLHGQRLKGLDDTDAPACDITDACIDALLATAPFSASGSIKARSNDDEKSLANRLAAVGQEFALHPFLGMAIDLSITLPKLPSGAGVLSRAPSLVCAKLAGLDAHSPWTVTGADGRALPDTTATPGPVRILTDGRFAVDDGYLTNVEIPANLTKILGALLESRDRADPATRGDQATQAALTVAALRTGPLTLHAKGRARAAALGAQGTMALADAPPADNIYLDQLVIGVRPDLKVARPGAKGRWLSLLGRDIVYGVHKDCGLGNAACHPDTTRMDGFIPLDRFEVRTETQAGEVTTTKDQLFEWSGWNPAVPMPGSSSCNLNGKLEKTITARPGQNPRYRYGWTVEASLRQVLRDGSSILLDAADVTMKSADPKVVARTGMDCAAMIPGAMAPLPAFKLKRFEPLTAPIAMLGAGSDRSGYSGAQAATKVVVVASGSEDVDQRPRKATRFIIPGAIRDILELERHGVFDVPGITPRSTGLARYERSTNDDEIFPSVGPKDMEQPVLRRMQAGGMFDPSKNYYPDPLVTALRLVLVRKNKAGDVFGIQVQNRPCEYIHTLYQGTQWPDAMPLRVDFVSAGRESMGNAWITGRAGRISINLPRGEAFELLVIPLGNVQELKEKHALAEVAPLDSALVSQAMTIHVESRVAVAYAPTLKRVTPSPRQFQSKAVVAECQATFDAATTTQLELVASWTDPFDNPAMGLPSSMRQTIADRGAEMVAAVFTNEAAQAVDEAIAKPALNTLVRAPVTLQARVEHEFSDTKHRIVTYRLRASYSSAGGEKSHQFITAEPGLPIPWPATAAPEAVSVVEATPSFRFLRDDRLLHSRSTREVAVSLFIQRGWDCSSGPGELLGIACGTGNSTEAPVSMWGGDPLRNTAPLARPQISLSDIGDSPHRVQLAQLPPGTAAAEVARASSLALFRPVFDEDELLWRVDVMIQVPRLVAQPLVKLVAVRFQPNALVPAMISLPTQVDFVQLPSRRSATIIGAYGGDPSLLHVSVAGPLGSGDGDGQAGAPQIEAELLFAESQGHGRDTWVPAGTRHALQPVGAPVHLVDRWEAVISLTAEMRRRRIAVRISERTRYMRDSTDRDGGTAQGELQYSDIVELKVFEGHGPGGPSLP